MIPYFKDGSFIGLFMPEGEQPCCHPNAEPTNSRCVDGRCRYWKCPDCLEKFAVIDHISRALAQKTRHTAFETWDDVLDGLQTCSVPLLLLSVMQNGSICLNFSEPMPREILRKALENGIKAIDAGAADPKPS